jgi:hypothetical protein
MYHYKSSILCNNTNEYCSTIQPLQLNDLPELLLVHICKFFLDRLDFSVYGFYNGRKGAKSCNRYVMN